MTINFATALLATGLALGMAGSTSAATVTQLIHFDDAKNGDKSYSDADGNFLFDPTNFQSSTLCADSTDGGNGSCLIEGKQGIVSTMTRLTGDKIFSLDGFYFLLTGKGEGAENALTATASGGGSITLQLGSIYSNITDELGNLVTTALQKNVGYFINLATTAGFQNQTSIAFTAATSAQVRLDCVTTSFDGNTSEPASSFSGSCGAPPAPVPVPAAGWFLLAGLGGLLAASRRKSA